MAVPARVQRATAHTPAARPATRLVQVGGRTSARVGLSAPPCPSLRQANYPEHASPCLTCPCCCGASHDAFIQIRAAPAPGCLQAPHVAQPLTAPRQQPCQAQAAALRQAPAVPLQLGGAGLAARRELPTAPCCATLVPASSGYTW